MKINKLNSRGFTHAIVALAFAVIFAVAGVAYLVASHANSITPSHTSTTSTAPAGYTSLGTIPAADLYNVKVPPASSQQPDMTLYACIQYTSSTTANVHFLGVLSYPVQYSLSSSWYIGLDLSSSATTDTPVSSKTTTYTYQSNAWVKKAGKFTTSKTITTADFSPGAVNDFFIWASGSYGGSTWPGLANHPDVTLLAKC